MAWHSFKLNFPIPQNNLQLKICSQVLFFQFYLMKLHTYSSKMTNVVETGMLWIVNGFLISILTCMLSMAGSYSTIGNWTTKKINSVKLNCEQLTKIPICYITN